MKQIEDRAVLALRDAKRPFVWEVTHDLVDYDDAILRMQGSIEDILVRRAPPLVWLLSHPSVYTVGTSGTREDILCNSDVPVVKSGRGGRVTYHGPGQRVVYFMCSLRDNHMTLKDFLMFLGQWIVGALASLGVKALFDDRDVGVWCETPQGRRKVAFMGIRVRKGVSYHGFSINVNPDLKYFDRIRPCGLEPNLVTSLAHIKNTIEMADIDIALRLSFEHLWHSL